MRNRIDYAKRGWELKADADIEYRSHIDGARAIDPDGWISAPAVNRKTGQHGKIWWWWPKNRRNIEVGGDWVQSWDKCHDIEINAE